MYIIPSTQQTVFLAKMAPKFRSYTSTFSARSISNFDDIMYAATHLYAYGTPFANPQSRTQPHYLKADIPVLETILISFVQKVWDYFNKKPANIANTQANFDVFHEELCDLFLNCITSAGVYTHEYGNAQKMVNMLFKYLTCFRDYEDFADLFSYCHIPIDRNILKSFKRNYDVANITPDLKYRYTDPTTQAVVEEPWSRMSKAAYKDLLINYRSALSSIKGHHSWLGMEYYIWAKLDIPTTGVHAVKKSKFYM